MNHRMSDYNPEEPCLTGLLDSTVCTSERTEAVIHLLQQQFIDNDQELDNRVIFAALETVRMDIKDIVESLAHYQDHQSKQQA